MDQLDLLQWPAMTATVAAAYLWGFHDHAWALVGLQFCLAALNIRGVYRNE